MAAKDWNTCIGVDVVMMISRDCVCVCVCVCV